MSHVPGHLHAYRVSVTATPGVLLDAETHGESKGVAAFIKNTGGAPIFLGGDDVTAADGFELTPNTTIGPLHIWPGSPLWAVKSGSGQISVHVLVDRRW